MDSFLGFERDTVLLVTGAGSGIGRALALLAGRQGLQVAAWDQTAKAAEATACEVRAQGGRARAWCLDVADKEAARVAIDETQAALGQVQCLAAVAAPPSFLPVSFEEGVSRTIDCVRVPTEAWLAASAEGVKSAVFLSSVQGPRYGAGVPWYTVAKSAIDGYMRSIAAMRPGGLRANAILPDWILTPRTAQYVEATGGAEWDANPMGRVGLPDDVAHAILFLLSPAAGYLNGQSIEIDGGAHLRSLAWMRMAAASGSQA